MQTREKPQNTGNCRFPTYLVTKQKVDAVSTPDFKALAKSCGRIAHMVWLPLAGLPAAGLSHADLLRSGLPFARLTLTGLRLAGFRSFWL